MEEIISRLLENPRTLAYECSRSKCDISDLSKAIVYILTKSKNLEDITPLLEFMSILKSLRGEGEPFNSIVNALARVKDKILEYTNPEVIVETYGRDKILASKLLMLLELYPEISLRDKMTDVLVGVIRRALEAYRSRHELLEEFLRMLIYGPLERLDQKQLAVIIEFFTSLGGVGDYNYTHVKVLFLSMIPESYPRRIFWDRVIVDKLSMLMHRVLDELVRKASRGDMEVEAVFDEVSLFITRMNNVCRDIGDWNPCERIVNSNLDALNKLARLIVENRTKLQ